MEVLLNQIQNEPYFQCSEGGMSWHQAEWFHGFLASRPEIRNVLEIGFNLGLGSAVMLNARPDTRVVSVDIGAHDYVADVKRRVDALWPGRHELIIGDSTSVLPDLVSKMAKFDMVFIDGGHEADVPYVDMNNAMRLLTPSGIVVIDDMNEVHGPDVLRAFKRMIDEGKVVNFLGPIHDHEMRRSWVVAKFT